MKRMLIMVVGLSMLATSDYLLAQQPPSKSARKQQKDEPIQNDAKQVYGEVKQAFGLVPTFIREFPQQGVRGAWEMLKQLEMNDEAALPAQLRQLIGLAVAAQTPCDYCAYYHTRFARLEGASEQAVKEAVAMAAITRLWSTVLNGSREDPAKFGEEVRRIFQKREKREAERSEQPATVATIETAEDAYRDIERTIGFVPSFFRRFPEEGIAGAWMEMKQLQLSKNTALSPKQKELLGLSVAAQIPCAYCVDFHTQAAKAHGASDREVQEAIAIAASTRHWSTVLNGLQIDPAKFRKETDRIVEHVRRKRGATARAD